VFSGDFTVLPAFAGMMIKINIIIILYIGGDVTKRKKELPNPSLSK